MYSKQNIHLRAYLSIQRRVDVKSFCGLNEHLEKSQLKAIKENEITHTPHHLRQGSSQAAANSLSACSDTFHFFAQKEVVKQILTITNLAGPWMVGA